MKWTIGKDLSLIHISALAEHLLANDDHVLKFGKTEILSSKFHYPTWVHWEATEIYKHNNDLNRNA